MKKFKSMSKTKRVFASAAAILIALFVIGGIFVDSESRGNLETTVAFKEVTSELFGKLTEDNLLTSNVTVNFEKSKTEKVKDTYVAPKQNQSSNAITLDTIPVFSNKAYIAINDSIPKFTQSDLSIESFESYSPLDDLGRCGIAVACIGKDIMPTEERGEIGQVKPSGWHTIKYDIVDGKYLYNRCHLIGYQLTGENSNDKNLITGTRYLNIEGMLPFENMVADYVEETGNHVLYRVTPIFKGDNLVANGVQIEAYSIEDSGEGICFNVYCYNSQPGITIDYATGESHLLSDEELKTTQNLVEETERFANSLNGTDYILNTNTKKFHYPYCHSVDRMKESNKKYFSGSRDDVIAKGYSPCGNCDP